MAHRHRFGHARPSLRHPHSQQAPRFHGSDFQPLPAPTGPAPYRLDLAAVVPDAVQAMARAGGMVLHIAGDTGGVRNPVPQELVAAGLEHDAGQAGALGRPAFLYHLGDVIYFDGQASEYYPQFYSPYEHYPLPVLAIPGNHDGDRFDRGELVNPEPSLAPFVRNFCATEPGVHTAEAGDMARTAMIQPNVYWTLLTPFATFIGLYTNVPEGGDVRQEQRDWFAGELQAADPGKPVLVALHHPIHSLDAYHSGSRAMADVLAGAVAAAGRAPAMVFAGHVHNYQRFTVSDAAGATPFVVAGHGGYHNLHRMARIGSEDIITPYVAPNDPQVVLESYLDDRFGFLRLEITPEAIELRSMSVPRPQESWRTPPRLFDRMRFDWRARRILR
ncbi:MAG: metallophosphoesterase [Rhodospirillales bacterium]|jgi:hypothetical protein|nr:metallophosphoesterase [Rhodospirillales bacterium]